MKILCAFDSPRAGCLAHPLVQTRCHMPQLEGMHLVASTAFALGLAIALACSQRPIRLTVFTMRLLCPFVSRPFLTILVLPHLVQCSTSIRAMIVASSPSSTPARNHRISQYCTTTRVISPWLNSPIDIAFRDDHYSDDTSTSREAYLTAPPGNFAPPDFGALPQDAKHGSVVRSGPEDFTGLGLHI